MMFSLSVSHHLFIKCIFPSLSSGFLNILAVTSESAFEIRTTGLKATEGEYVWGLKGKQPMLEVRAKKLHKNEGLHTSISLCSCIHNHQSQSRKQNLPQPSTSSLSIMCQRKLQQEHRSALTSGGTIFIYQP